jgi:hypothetical protein
MRRLGLLFLAAWLGCGSGTAGPGDAGHGADASPYFDCGDKLDAGLFGWLVVGDQQCIRCVGLGEAGDEECTALAGDELAPGCRAYCEGTCMQVCEGRCSDRIAPDAGACAPGELACSRFAASGVYVCDPACPPAGGCRPCAFDDECVLELGEDAHCQRHCGTCCHPDGDAGVPCSCI